MDQSNYVKHDFSERSNVKSSKIATYTVLFQKTSMILTTNSRTSICAKCAFG